ncbi:hypothetical protein MH117_05145 [Paenibacillus sp. ACRRX]|uniref:hypothetical protein n=1 Tax=Paenibacillus sp. ACRRX TaxID=2918206 RepID=UPI001EF4E62B|nr:hypothetical protein [Paenibacillus sp. ACRRX]MCG7406797.1 hypothetical protein [Paenibacillus sp. ACRRX]
MHYLYFILIIGPIGIIIGREISQFLDDKRYVLLPIKYYINTGKKISPRGKYINTYNAYSKCSDREIVIQKFLVRSYMYQSKMVNIITDLFVKLMFPFMTFVLLFSITGISNYFLGMSNKVDRKEEPNSFKLLFDSFLKVLGDYIDSPIAILLAITISLFIGSFVINTIASNRNKFMGFHEDIVNRIISERGIENTPLSDLNK